MSKIYPDWLTFQTKAFALGYYYGRAVGNDEERLTLMEGFPEDVRAQCDSAFSDGYHMGVGDYTVEMERMTDPSLFWRRN